MDNTETQNTLGTRHRMRTYKSKDNTENKKVGLHGSHQNKDELMCSWRVSSSCFSYDTSHVRILGFNL